MKTKKFFNTLFNNLFNLASISDTKASIAKTDDAEKTDARNDLLTKIYWAICYYQLENMENYIRKYLVTYGHLSGTEEVWFWERFDEHFTDIGSWKSKKLLYFATEFTEKFFFALVNGEEAAAKEYRHKAELQSALKKAFEKRDIVSFDKLISAGADINYVYCYAWGCRRTLWEQIKNTQGRMYEYFMTRMDIPEVKAFREKKKAEEELIVARKAQIV